MIHAIAEVNQVECVFWLHRIASNLGDERHVLASGKTWDQVVELENESDVLATITRECGIAECGNLFVFVLNGAAGRNVEPAKDIEQC